MPLDVVAEDVCPAASNTSKSCGDLMPPGLTLPDTTEPLAGGKMPWSLTNSTGAAIPAVIQPQMSFFKALVEFDDPVFFEVELIQGLFVQRMVPLNLEGVEKGQRKEMLHNSLCARPLTVSAAPLPHHPSSPSDHPPPSPKRPFRSHHADIANSPPPLLSPTGSQFWQRRE